MVPPYSDRISRVPPYSRTTTKNTPTGLSPTLVVFPNTFGLLCHSHWPDPRSLATTSGVSIDILSYRYLDVSVPCVRFLTLCIQVKITFYDYCKSETGNEANLAVRLRNYSNQGWVSPFGNHRVKAYSQLTDAYRSVSRPSSPVHAKASTKCP